MIMDLVIRTLTLSTNEKICSYKFKITNNIIMMWTVTYFNRFDFIVDEIDFALDTEEEAIMFAELIYPEKATHYELVNTELIN